MVKLSDVVKTFCLRFYLLIIIFLIAFGINILVENKNKLQTPPNNYVSTGEISVSPKGVNSSNGLENYMNNIIYRVTNGSFTDYIYLDIVTELEEPTGMFDDYKEEDMRLLQSISSASLKSDISISCIENTTIFSISYKSKSAKVAQDINNLILTRMCNILVTGDTEDILGGRPINESNALNYSITKKATLPSSASLDVSVSSNTKTLLKLAIISVAIYAIIVIIYDFSIGFITNKQKVATMVRADIISEIEMPYQKAFKAENNGTNGDAEEK